MITVINESRQVSVPTWVQDMDSFRRWVNALGHPEYTLAVREAAAGAKNTSTEKNR